jgi:outer membrane lipoprotein LolB
MRGWLDAGVALAIGGLLAACAGQPKRTAPPVSDAAARQAQVERTTVLAAHPRWSLQGRVALSNGRNGGSGRIEWQQDGPRYGVALSAPVTRQSWRLTGDGGSARLEGLDGGDRQGPDAQALLHEATGWIIPVAALASWVRGTADLQLPPATLQFDADGRLASLQQSGWTIDYSQWQPQPTLGIELPHRLDASHGDARVKLVIDAWEAGEAAP